MRVQFPTFLRELRGIDSEDDFWTAQRAMKSIAINGSGVLIILNYNQAVVTEFDEISDSNKNQYAYHNVGVGSQILKSLSVGKMKLMSPELRYPALSGFGLEITEFIHYEK